jgi:hypothetical protein
VQVVRCFEDTDIHHVAGDIDPIRDIETILTELVLADLETAQRRRDKGAKDAKRGDKVAMGEAEVLDLLIPHLNAGKPAITLKLTLEQKAIAGGFFLLTDKPTIFAANVKEGDLATADSNPHVQKVREYARTHIACQTVVISAQIESDLIDLTPEEAREFLQALGVQESGIGALIRSTYHLLGLRTYFTAGEKKSEPGLSLQGILPPKPLGPFTAILSADSLKQKRSLTMTWSNAVRWRQLGKRPLPHRRQGVCRARWRRAPLQIQRLTLCIGFVTVIQRFVPGPVSRAQVSMCRKR